jgi:hypothetical protein
MMPQRQNLADAPQIQLTPSGRSVLNGVDTGKWPNSVSPDCVGQLLGREDLRELEVYRDHIEKHSFLNTDTLLFGRDEPIASANNRRHNRADAHLEVYSVSLRALAQGFQAFALCALAELREISRQIQDRQAPHNDPENPAAA